MSAVRSFAFASGARMGLSDRDCGYFIPPTRGGELSREGVTVAFSRDEMIEADGAITCSAWFLSTAAAMLRLTSLPAGWDFQTARPIQRPTVQKALRWLAMLLDAQTQKPSVVPTVGGGVQVEWHMGGLDIEIEFQSDRDPFVSLEDIRDGVEWEGDLYPNIDRLRGYLPRLKAA